jgi:hypothetical protein
VVEDPYNPRWSYAATKLTGELFVIHYARRYRHRLGPARVAEAAQAGRR